jgi:hypothetical protein
MHPILAKNAKYQYIISPPVKFYYLSPFPDALKMFLQGRHHITLSKKIGWKGHSSQTSFTARLKYYTKGTSSMGSTKSFSAAITINSYAKCWYPLRLLNRFFQTFYLSISSFITILTKAKWQTYSKLELVH